MTKKTKKRKPHLIPHSRVFPQFYGPEADKDWEEGEKREKVPVEKKKKPKKRFRYPMRVT